MDVKISVFLHGVCHNKHNKLLKFFFRITVLVTDR